MTLLDVPYLPSNLLREVKQRALIEADWYRDTGTSADREFRKLARNIDTVTAQAAAYEERVDVLIYLAQDVLDNGGLEGTRENAETALRRHITLMRTGR